MPGTPPNNPGDAGNGAKPGQPVALSPKGPARSMGSVSISPDAPAALPMVKCPKCGTDVREVARFCPRCHMTLRYTCPSCAHEQRHGGMCEKCGVDFVKYLGAVVTSERTKSDMLHERIQSRSNFLMNLALIPFTGGLHLIKYLFPGSRTKKR
jgi:hypothetical protein